MGRHHRGERLSRRESSLLYMLIRGYTDKEIAEAENIEPGSVNTLLRRIQLRFNLPSRQALIEWAEEQDYDL